MSADRTTKLRDRWNNLYKAILPNLAKSKDSVQPTWPVHLDHCFARIILDNAVGITSPWTAVLKSPAYKHMTVSQLEDAITLGESIAVGEASLVELNERSLRLRDKAGPKTAATETKAVKRKVDPTDDARDSTKQLGSASPTKKAKTAKTTGPSISSYFVSSPSAPLPEPGPATCKEDTSIVHEENGMQQALSLISSSTLTPFRKQVLTLLCQVPRGRYTTYAAMSTYISQTSHKTCARAVGNAMRNNPFAPMVPCHRVLATGGKIGGFGGHWGEEGMFAGKKRELLREEGVKFWADGKVVGAPFVGFS